MVKSTDSRVRPPEFRSLLCYMALGMSPNNSLGLTSSSLIWKLEQILVRMGVKIK